ncbi:MAG: YncE family protein [Nitrososphaerales archaeon]
MGCKPSTAFVAAILVLGFLVVALGLGLSVHGASGYPSSTYTISGSPQKVALAYDNHDLYVVNTDGYVTVFNPSSGSAVKNITASYPALSYPAYDNVSTDIYVANEGGSMVVIHTNNNTLGSSINIPNFLVSDVAYGNGEIFAIGSNKSTTPWTGLVMVFSPQKGKFVANITVGASPYYGAYDVTDNRLYVTNYVSNSTSVIEVATNKVVATVPVPNNPFAVEYGNGEVYVTESNSNVTAVIDTTTNTIVANVKVGNAPESVAFAQGSGDELVGVTSSGVNGTGTTSFIDPYTNEVVGSIQIPRGPEMLIYDPYVGEFFIVQGNGFLTALTVPLSLPPATSATTNSLSNTTLSTNETSSSTSTSALTNASSSTSAASSGTSSLTTTSRSSSQTTTTEGGRSGIPWTYYAVAIVIVAALGILFFAGGIPLGRKPPPKVPSVDSMPAKVKKETYTYEASMHSDATGDTGGAGHAWPDLRVTKTVTEDAIIVSTEVTGYKYDFAPQGSNAFYTNGEVVCSKVTTSTDEGDGDEGGRPPTKSEIATAYFPIAEDGFNAAKAWADSTVSREAGHAKKPPGRPPNYKVLTYNCVDYTLNLCARAGVDITSFKQSGPSTPSNLASLIRQRTCKHEWELLTVSHLGIPVSSGETITPPPTHMWVCKTCALTKPFEELTGPPPLPRPPPSPR